jgi:ribosomal protein RSM22 (predicted rRNA methylase)
MILVFASPALKRWANEFRRYAADTGTLYAANLSGSEPSCNEPLCNELFCNELQTQDTSVRLKSQEPIGILSLPSFTLVLMRMPDRLSALIEQELSVSDKSAIARAAALLTDRYHEGRFADAALSSTPLRLAYLRVRMPATFAACAHVFREVSDRLPGSTIQSMLDLGSGPGTAMWAAAEAFPEMQKLTAVERDSELIEVGRRLAFGSNHPALRASIWHRQDIAAGLADIEAHDLVVVSYCLGELSAAVSTQLIRRAWALAGKVLVIVEPGTPRNFQTILAARQQLLDLGGKVVSPCPHGMACPLAAAGDWCHFSQRLERTAEHRRMKGGTLGYEDEKFSYFVAAKLDVDLPAARIVRHPLKHPGHVKLTLCTPQNIQQSTIGKSKKADYRRARQAVWGDAWNIALCDPHS